MKTILTALAIAFALAAPGTADSQILPSSLEVRFQNHLLSETLSPDGRLRHESGVDAMQLRNYFHDGLPETPSGGFLTAGVDRLYGIERYEVSGLQVMMHGAEMGVSAGLFAGAVGSTFAGWDDKTVWSLVGAAAAAGALWGGTHADDPGWRVRYRWEPDE